MFFANSSLVATTVLPCCDLRYVNPNTSLHGGCRRDRGLRRGSRLSFYRMPASKYRRGPIKESAMQYTKLGRTGLDVSRLCLGCMSYGGGNSGFHQWSLGEEESRPFIKKALEAGINFFDTANRYSVGKSEEVLGRALNDFARREEVVIATKV
jgi:hypothetical protein